MVSWILIVFRLWVVLNYVAALHLIWWLWVLGNVNVAPFVGPLRQVTVRDYVRLGADYLQLLTGTSRNHLDRAILLMVPTVTMHLSTSSVLRWLLLYFWEVLKLMIILVKGFLDSDLLGRWSRYRNLFWNLLKESFLILFLMVDLRWSFRNIIILRS